MLFITIVTIVIKHYQYSKVVKKVGNRSDFGSIKNIINDFTNVKVTNLLFAIVFFDVLLLDKKPCGVCNRVFIFFTFLLLF